MHVRIAARIVQRLGGCTARIAEMNTGRARRHASILDRCQVGTAGIRAVASSIVACKAPNMI
jgi:hypothetical protein